MDLIRQCFEEYDSTLTKRLTDIGFSPDQAGRFLPAAASGISVSTQQSSVFQTIACLLSGAEYQLQRRIDIVSIARKTGLDGMQIMTGLHVIAPVLLKAFSEKSINGVSLRAITSARTNTKEQDEEALPG